MTKMTKELKVTLTFTDEVLGMMPANKELHETYIASKAPDASTITDEVEAVGVEEVVEKTMTVFPKLEDGTPFIWDYQIRGMLKDAMGMLRKVADYESSKIKAFKKAVANGATPVLEPELEPWGQRTCYIADPEGNLIEIGSWNKPYEVEGIPNLC